jgi:hypothetical protein
VTPSLPGKRSKNAREKNVFFSSLYDVRRSMDPLSPAITFFDSEGKGRTSYIGSLVPEKLFYPTPGLWFTQQDNEVMPSQYSSTLVTCT